MMSAHQDRDAATVRFPPPLLYVISIILGHWLHRQVHPWPLPGLEGLARTSVGLGLVFAGICLAVVALSHFSRTGQNPEPWKPTPSILVDGIYRYSRNPMYVAMATVQIGVGVYLGSLWIIVLMAVSQIAVFIVAVRPEEAYLERKFGDEYRQYKARVRRWL